MTQHRSNVSGRWRSLALVLAGLLAGTLFLGTAGAHVTDKVGHLWKHLKNRVIKLSDKHYSESAISGFWDGPLDIPGATLSTLKTLEVGPGSYVAFGKAWFFNTAGTGVLVHCRLDTTEGDFDETRVGLGPNGDATAGEAAAFQVAHTFAGPGQFELQCSDFGSGAQARFIKITALPLDNLSNAPLT